MDHIETELEPLKFWNGYEQLLSDVITTYVASIWTICIVSGKVDNVSEFLNAFSAIPYMSIQLAGLEGKFNSTNSPLLEGIESGCSGFVVHQSVALEFLDIFVELHDEAGYRSSSKYVLVLGDGDQSDEFLEYFREHPSLPEILNLLIFRPMFQNTTVDLLTNKFVGNVEHASALYLLDRYHVEDDLFEFGNWLFPDKTIDLYGKTIRLATFYINPQMLIKESEVTTSPAARSNNRTFSIDGLNGLILVEFCRKRNCSIELVIDEVNMWGVILPNRSGNGIIGDVAERRADLGMGGLSSWYHCYQYLAFSTPITRGRITCLVPKPNHIPRWRLITMVFPTSVYLLIFGTFCSVISVYILISHFMIRKIEQKSVFWNAFNVLAVFLQQSTNIRNRTASEVILTVALLLYVMNMDGIYSGKYASLLTIPIYETAINTVNDLASSGIPWLQTHKAWSFSLLISQNPTIVKLVSNFRAYPPSELRRIADQGGAAFALSNLNIGHLMLGDWITATNVHKYRLMRDELYHEHEVAMATKTWPLMERFNEEISQTVSGMLLRAQRLRIVFQYDDYYVHTVALNSHEREENDPTALGLEDILGGLIILGFGVLCAGAVFILEVIFVRRSRRSK